MPPGIGAGYISGFGWESQGISAAFYAGPNRAKGGLQSTRCYMPHSLRSLELGSPEIPVALFINIRVVGRLSMIFVDRSHGACNTNEDKWEVL